MRPLYTVSLRNLFPHASFIGCGDIRVRDASCSSSQVIEGGLFAALPGTSRHGREYLSEAQSRGAAAVLTDQPLASCLLPQCVVANPRDAYAKLCHALFGDPTRDLGVVGVTGTNGKTTTTWMIRSILEAARGACGLIGTIENSDGLGRAPSTLTTPGCRELAALLAATRRNGVRFSTLEMSSHALDQSRTAGTRLDVAIITNLTQDHFDYHGSFENYRQAKSRIISNIKRGGTLVLNADDAYVLALRETADARIITYSLFHDADVRGEILEATREGTHFRVNSGVESVLFFTPLIGEYNVSNALAAIAGCQQLGVPLREIVPGVARLSAVPGRMQRVTWGQDFEVWVDYAHTDDGLSRAIAAVRPLIRGRLTVVFGAGGDRDPDKRPKMGLAASAADHAVITSDNPRSESPVAIAQAILAGWERDSAPELILDRQSAIQHAIQQARPGDGILIAGKGHEQTQIEGTTIRPFCDVSVAQEAIESLRNESLSWPTGPHRGKSHTSGKVSHHD